MTTQTKQTVADLTVAEFKELIRETVAESIAELLGDPDDELVLRPEFIEEMETRMTTGEPAIPAEEVYRRAGLD
jgi:hypothetical protein